MQEEMNEKTVSLIIRGTKVTAVVLKDAMKMFLRQTSNRVSNGRDGKGTSDKQKQVSQPGRPNRENFPAENDERRERTYPISRSLMKI